MKIINVKFFRKYLEGAFIYLYICPLFLLKFFFFSMLIVKKEQIFLKLISNNQIYNTCPLRRGNPFVCGSFINFRHLRSSTSGKLLNL